MDEEIRKIINDHEKRIESLEKLVEGEEDKRLKKKMSIKEFILSKKPRNDVQKTLTMGFFLENYEGFSLFNSDDLKKCFRNAKEKVPKNINDCVNQNINKGYMQESVEKKENKKAWSLTNSGEQFVENNFKKVK